MNDVYYRPIWTCGRYNKQSNVAIFYNLIAGFSYFFEDHSAMVIGLILDIPRNGTVSIGTISEKLNINMESLKPFFNQLETLGLISSVYTSNDVVANYRSRIREYNYNNPLVTNRSIQEKLPYAISNAEQLYTEKVGKITSVMLELTYRCSEKCIHCYNIGANRNDDEHSGRGDRDELCLEDYKKLIDDLYDQGLIKVCLSGGDPFSKSFVWEIIQYLYERNLAFDIFTNGQRIVNEVDRLANYYPRTVGVSIYSGLPKVHDYITRVPGSWEKSMRVVKRLSELAVPMNLKCCIMRPNVKSYYMVADIAKQYGAVPQFEISLTDSIEGDRCVSKYLRMTPEQLEIVLRDDNIPLYVGKEAPNYGGQKKQLDQNPCGAGENSLCITPEGNVIPCCAFHMIFGNIRKNQISDIINSSQRLKYWRSLKLSDYEECGKQDFCDYCNLCPGNNFIEHDTPLKAAEVNCYMAKSRFNLAHKMKLGYDPLQGKSIYQRLSELQDYKPIKLRREMS